MGSGLGAGGEGLQSDCLIRADVTTKDLSIFSHFSYENQTKNPEGKVSISQL